MSVTSRTERNAALLLAEAGLWVVIAGGLLSLASALRSLLAFEWAFSWSLPSLLGGRTYVPSLPATLRPDDPEVRLPQLAWEDTANGTVDAATGLPPVSIGPPVHAQVEWVGFEGLTTTEMAVWSGPQLIAGTAVIVAAWLLVRIVRSARHGEVFSMASAIRLRWLAAVIGVGGLAYNALDSWGANWILSNSAAASHLDTSTFTLDLTPIWVSLVVAAFAVIWEHGVRLARDADGLV